MATKKRIDLGEYIIEIHHELYGKLIVTILDELEEVIEEIIISNSGDDDYNGNNDDNGDDFDDLIGKIRLN